MSILNHGIASMRASMYGSLSGAMSPADNKPEPSQNSPSYSHMSRLRSTVNLISIRATSERLLAIVEKFKDFELQVVKSTMSKRNLWESFEKVLGHLNIKTND